MKKGYTLVELLGVLVVLGIIATVATVVILNVVRDANDALDTNTRKLLYTAAERYLNDNVTMQSNGNYSVTIDTLISNDLISRTFLESQEDANITGSSCVKVNVSNGNISYDFSYTC